MLNYQAHNNTCLSLRPQGPEHASKVANNSVAIFLTFGALKILQIDNGRESVNCIIIEWKELLPDNVIVYG